MFEKEAKEWFRNSCYYETCFVNMDEAEQFLNSEE